MGPSPYVFILVFIFVLSIVIADEYHAFIPTHHRQARANRNKRETASGSNTFNVETTAAYWNFAAQLKLSEQLYKQPNFNIAKNVIFFLGDGMSIPTLAASRMYMGQLQGHTGEEASLFFESFPYTGLSKTYCVDKQTADSACSATAYLCGVKANYGTIGVTAAVDNNDCKASNNKSNHVDSLATWALRAGKGTGFVTTTRVTHASPCGLYGHVGNREWECDFDVQEYHNDPKTCQDIASQLVNNEPGNKFKVIFGGGRKKFLPKDVKDEEGQFGQRLDGVNLIDKWKQSKKGPAKYVYDRMGLQNLDFNATQYVLGLFESDHMQFHLDANPKTEPTLLEMTEAAIKILQKEKRGYFLFVEGGRIDHGHHETKARKALDETVQFADAIRLATEMTDRRDTLIVITSDHAHTMSLAGYSDRGTDILALNTMKSDKDGLPYTTLSYANGPGYKTPQNNIRYDLTNDNLESPQYEYPGIVPLKSETHGGDDVGVFAYGPWQQLFTGVYEQNVIPHMVAYAACLGDGLTACRRFPVKHNNKNATGKI